MEEESGESQGTVIPDTLQHKSNISWGDRTEDEEEQGAEEPWKFVPRANKRKLEEGNEEENEIKISNSFSALDHRTDDEESSGLPEVVDGSSTPGSPLVPPLSTSEEEVEVSESESLSGGFLPREDVESFKGTTGFMEGTNKEKGNEKKAFPAALHK
ncbi:UNVERIFIED_CONTAM: hypothetical protein FKN15_019594 [Acipenser sinensis]